MKHIAHLSILPLCLLLSGITSVTSFSEVPRLPFSGIYGATAGAGSLTGWGRHGGDNPAVIAGPGWSASVAGYAPFGLDGLRVMELEAARDQRRWSLSLGVRALFDDGGSVASRWNAQGAWKPHEDWSMGGSLRVHAAHGNPGMGGGVGALWNPHRALSLGAAWESTPDPVESASRYGRLGVGMDVGHHFGARPAKGSPSGSMTRASVEYFLTPGDAGSALFDDHEWRFGLGLRFHPLLSIHAGFSPRHQSAALGVRFGMGDWEGFSALRRHAALGGTSVQGLRWHSSEVGKNRLKSTNNAK
jgi:hypothetical protein